MIKKGDLVRIKRPSKKISVFVVRDAYGGYIATRKGIFSKKLVVDSLTPTSKFKKSCSILLWFGLLSAILGIVGLIGILISTESTIMKVSLVVMLLGVLCGIAFKLIQDLKDTMQWSKE